MSNETLRNAQIDREAVRFSIGLALENPADYSIEEMRKLIERHDVSQGALDKAMREDLASMPPNMQETMKKMLKGSSIPDDVWKDIFGKDF